MKNPPDFVVDHPMTTTDPAERLRSFGLTREVADFDRLLDAALAAERHATVERIRAAYRRTDLYRLRGVSVKIDAILDAEAGR